MRRFGIQTKLLIPVVVCLVLVPVMVAAIVARFLNGQELDAGRTDLSTAQRIFQRTLDERQHELLLRFRPVAQSPAAFAPAQKFAVATPETLHSATATLQGDLKQFSEQLREAAIIVFTGRDARGPAIAVKQPNETVPEDRFVAVAHRLTEAALKGEESTGVATLADSGGDAAVYVVAVPVAVDDQVLGALTFGVRLDLSALQLLKNVTGSEIVLRGEHAVIGSTLGPASLPAADDGGRVEVEGLHYLARSGRYGGSAPPEGVEYTLLYSLEKSLRLQADMTRVLTLVGIAAVALSVAAVWFFTGRSLRPLQELRDSAEAVGRGDFSRRIARYSHDECGDLADAFNRMTGNLQQSRTELESTVDTLRNTQAQLIQSEKLSAVGQFVSGVAHELNNPLAAVIGFSELLAQTGSDEKIKPHLDMIAKSAQRCHKIVQNLLSFARQHPPERKLVGVNSVVEEVLDFMAYEFRTSNIVIERQLAEGLPAIMADGHQLQQVFVNILGNARQAIQGFRREGKIIARTSLAAANLIRVELIDDGPGIRPENLSRIFDPFFTTKAVGKGTGLGLSLTYGIIREHGGTVRAESVVGHGATFIIELPVASQQVARTEAARRPALRSKPAPPSGKTVLVVDDEEWLLALAENLLRQDGHMPVTAHSGEEAIDLLGRRRIDLIISDWKMPGLSGAAFYEHLQAVNPEAAGRILFMTGDVMNEALLEFMARHGKVCLSKPFPIDEFRTAVSAGLESALL